MDPGRIGASSGLAGRDTDGVAAGSTSGVGAGHRAGFDDQACGEAGDFVTGQRDLLVRGWGAPPFTGSGNGYERGGEHGKGDPAMPGGPASDLVLIEPGQIRARLAASLPVTPGVLSGPRLGAGPRSGGGRKPRSSLTHRSQTSRATRTAATTSNARDAIPNHSTSVGGLGSISTVAKRAACSRSLRSSSAISASRCSWVFLSGTWSVKQNARCHRLTPDRAGGIATDLGT
jgi:hypothetical protein